MINFIPYKTFVLKTVHGNNIEKQNQFSTITCWLRKNLPKKWHGNWHAKMMKINYTYFYQVVVQIEKPESVALFKLFWSDDIINN